MAMAAAARRATAAAARSLGIARYYEQRSRGVAVASVEAAAAEDELLELRQVTSEDKQVMNKLGRMMAESKRTQVPLTELLKGYTGPFTVDGFCRTLRGTKSVDFSRTLLDWAGQQPGFQYSSTVICSAVKGLYNANLLDEGRKLVLDEFKDRFQPTEHVYNRIVKHYVAKGDLKAAKGVVEEMASRGFRLDKTSTRCLFQVRFEEAGMAGFMDLFNEKVKAGWVPFQEVCDFMVRKLCEEKKTLEAVDFFKLCKSYGCQPEDHTYHVLMKQLSAEKKLDEAYELGKMLLELGELKCESPPFKTVVNSLADAGKLDQAFDLFTKLKEKGSVPAGLQLVSALCKHRDFDRAIQVAKAHGCSTKNEFSAHKSLITALCKDGKLDEAKRSFEFMLEQGGSPDADLCNIVSEAVVKSFSEDDPRRKSFFSSSAWEFSKRTAVDDDPMELSRKEPETSFVLDTDPNGEDQPEKIKSED